MRKSFNLWLVFGFCLGVLVYGLLFLGAWSSCEASDGVLVQNGALWKCWGVEDAPVCEFGGEYFVSGGELENLSVLEGWG